MGTDPKSPSAHLSRAVVEKIRTDYTRDHLDEAELASDPFAQFEAWLAHAVAAGVPEPNAMTLATAGEGGMPAARIVLLRDFDRRGLVFYTNYESDKGR